MIRIMLGKNPSYHFNEPFLVFDSEDQAERFAEVYSLSCAYHCYGNYMNAFLLTDVLKTQGFLWISEEQPRS